MAWHQQSPSSDSSALSGQGTPDVSDGEGNADRGRSHTYYLSRSRDNNGSENHDDSEMYELEVFGSDAVQDGEYSGDDGPAHETNDRHDRNDGNDWSGRDGTNRTGGERRLSASTVASFQLYTPDEERAVVRKFDRRLVVFLAFCYMLSFVDRSSTSQTPLAYPFLSPPTGNFFLLTCFFIS